MASKIICCLDKFIKIICVALFVVLLFTIFLAVFDRFIFHVGLFWTEELARILFVWLGFLMSSLAINRVGHFKVTYFTDTFLGRLPRKALNIAIEICLVFLMIFLIYFGANLATYVESQITPGLRISMSYLYASVPVSAVFGLIFQIYRVISVIRDEDNMSQDSNAIATASN
jgi:TRAP-type C4-dicarboxylate transport system permease small subunit